MITFQYASDLHLELFDTIPRDIIIPCAPYLLLAGDIGMPFKNNYYEFLSDMSTKFIKIFIISGNHEYHYNQYNHTNQQIRNIVEKFDNVIYLDNQVYELDGIKILGTTLWSDIDDYGSMAINDFYVIEYRPCELISKEIYVKLHKEAIQFLENEIHRDDMPKLIITHHAPHPCMNGKYRGNKLESAFSTDLTYLFQPPVKAFICGHTHQNIETKINDIPLVSNCYGYDKSEQLLFVKNKKIAIEL